MSQATFAVVAVDEQDAPIAGLGVILSTGHEGITNQDGYAAFVVTTGGLQFEICGGDLFLDFVSDAFVITQNLQRSVTMKRKAALPTPTPIPPSGGGQSGPLRISGREIIDDTGKPWCLAGYAIYTVIACLKRGQDIRPLLDEAASYGANTIVGLSMDLGSWAFANGYDVDPRDPRWPDWLATLFDTAAARQMRVALGVFQQAQNLSDAEKRTAWRTVGDVARGRWNAILRLGNESNVNGWDPASFGGKPDLGGVLLTTGSRGINNPPTPPQWDVAEWEPRRSPVYKAMDDAGAGALEIQDGQPGCPTFNGPIWIIEPPFFNDVTPDMWGDTRWTDPKLALKLGLNIGANTSGGVYGDSYSLIGQTSHSPECTRQFFRGLHAGFVR
jgi:hypothetical protein